MVWRGTVWHAFTCLLSIPSALWGCLRKSPASRLYNLSRVSAKQTCPQHMSCRRLSPRCHCIYLDASSEHAGPLVTGRQLTGAIPKLRPLHLRRTVLGRHENHQSMGIGSLARTAAARTCTFGRHPAVLSSIRRRLRNAPRRYNNNVLTYTEHLLRNW